MGGAIVVFVVTSEKLVDEDVAAMVADAQASVHPDASRLCAVCYEIEAV